MTEILMEDISGKTYMLITATETGIKVHVEADNGIVIGGEITLGEITNGIENAGKAPPSRTHPARSA